MNDPSSALGKAIIGNANYMTAAICKLTNNQPAIGVHADDSEAGSQPGQLG